MDSLIYNTCGKIVYMSYRQELFVCISYRKFGFMIYINVIIGLDIPSDATEP